MKITAALKDFLATEEKRLSGDTFNKYLWVVELFEDYLANYSSIPKTKPDKNYGESIITGTVKQITEKEINEFLNVFVIKKVSSTYNEMRTYLIVLEKFVRYLLNNDLIDETKATSLKNTIRDAKNLPKTAKASDLLFALARNNVLREYSEILSGNFVITKIEKYCIGVREDINHRIISPVLLTEEITATLEENMVLHLELGKCEEGWVVIESGNVYLKLIET